MSTGKTNLTSTQFAAKKLLGKAHTSNLKGDVNEAIPSSVSIVSDGVFAEPIPNEPIDQMYVRSSASVGEPQTVEKVFLDVVSLSDTIYDANDPGGGGDEASGNGAHGYYLKLPSNYQTTSSNPSRGTGNFTNGKRIYDSRGSLQLVPPFVSNASPNKYFLKLYKGDPTNPANEITSGDNIDWQVDYYSGVVFIQDYNASTIPVSASAFLYVGKYLNEKVSSGTNLTVKEEGVNLTTVANSIDFVGAYVTASTSGNDVTVTINAGAGGGGDVSYGRTNVNGNYTATANDKILGVNAAAALKITLPAASDFSAGQYFTIKDEAGNANTYNITVSASSGDRIDGEGEVILQSPYAAINLYSNGTNKFFIY